MTEALLQMKDVEFCYPGQTHPAVSVRSFQIQQAENVFLFGPSGSGKSTFLELIAGVLVPQKGSIHVEGQNLAQLSDQERDRLRLNRLGYIFQSFNLIPYLSVTENVLLPVHLGRQSSSSVSQEAEQLLDKLGLVNFRHRPVHQLSVGQQQRVAVARALIGEPRLILADEPTSALDYDHRERFIKLLFQLAQEKKMSILFVSHDRTLEKLFHRSVSFLDLSRSTGGS